MNPISSCGEVLLFGGHKVFNISHKIERIFRFGAIPHSKIFLEMEIFLLDFWNNEILIINTDSKTLMNIPHKSSLNSTLQLCGSNSYDHLITISKTFEHSSETMVLEILINSEDGEVSTNDLLSFGIKNLNIHLIETKKVNSKRIFFNDSECEKGFYKKIIDNCSKKGFYGDIFCSKCVRCHYLCSECFGGSQFNCTSCIAVAKFNQTENHCFLWKGE
jgi:hypothetical protein